ncbi:MAG: glycosyltransferase [Ktedonobacteraceae bacterium]
MNLPVNAMQRTILFLIADTGAGHRSAANAINNAITLISKQQQQEWQARLDAQPPTQDMSGAQKTMQATVVMSPPTYRVEIVDVFEEYSRFPLREAVKLYGPTIRYNPKLYGEFFKQSNRDSAITAVKTIATPLIFNGLLRLITTVQPDVIISIHPMLNHVTVQALRELRLNIPFITVVTDLISIHHAWFTPGVERYIVPTEQAKQLYLQRGLDPEHVSMLGMPIDPKYTVPVASKAELQRKFNLQPGVPTILLVGGGDGAGGLQKAVRAISRAHLPVQLMVVTGRNRRLYTHLQRTRASLHVPAKIFGFVQNMPELMHASDVIITKAGPGTICEALSCHLPVILSGYVPGQEEGNIDFVVSNEVGVLALEPPTLIDALRRLIRPGSPELRHQQANAKRISRPRASFDIAACILSYLPAVEKASVWQSQKWQLRRHTMSSRLKSAIRIRRLRRRLPSTLMKSPMMRRLTNLRIRGFAEGDKDIQ